MKFHWFLPTNGGDGHGVSHGTGGRPASVAAPVAARASVPFGGQRAAS